MPLQRGSSQTRSVTPKLPLKKKATAVSLGAISVTPTTAQQATDVKVIQRQRDELRIRIQHLLHLLHESQDKVSEQATEIQVLKHALSDEFLGNVTIEGLSLLDNDSRADTRKFRKTDASQLPKDTTLDSVFGNPQALQTAAHLESLQSELAAYKSTCTKLDERVNSLSMQLMNERNHHLKDVKELEAQIGSMKCFHCGQAMSPTGRSTPTLNGVRKATQIHSSEPLAQSTFDQSTLESFLDGEAPHRTAVQTIYRSDSKNLVLENHEAVSPVKWMDMEQKPFHMDGYAPENASLSFYPATEIHLDPYGVRNTEPQPASSVSTPHGLPSQTILENVSSVPPTKLNHVASQQAGNPLLEKPALSSVPKQATIQQSSELPAFKSSEQASTQPNPVAVIQKSQIASRKPKTTAFANMEDSITESGVSFEPKSDSSTGMASSHFTDSSVRVSQSKSTSSHSHEELRPENQTGGKTRRASAFPSAGSASPKRTISSPFQDVFKSVSGIRRMNQVYSVGPAIPKLAARDPALENLKASLKKADSSLLNDKEIAELLEDTIETPNLPLVGTEKSTRTLSGSSSQGDLPVIPMNPFLFLNIGDPDKAETNIPGTQDSKQLETVLDSINQLQSVLTKSVESLSQPSTKGLIVKLSSSSLNPTTTDSDSSSMPVALRDKTKLQAPKKTDGGDSETDYDDLLGSLLDITQIKEPVRNEPPSRTRRLSEAILSATRPNSIARSDQDSGSNSSSHRSATRRSSVAVPKSHQSLASTDTKSHASSPKDVNSESSVAFAVAATKVPLQSASVTASETTSDHSGTGTRRQSMFSGSTSPSAFDPSKKVRKFSMALPQAYDMPRRFSVMNTSPRVTTKISETPLSKEIPFLKEHDAPQQSESDSLSLKSVEQTRSHKEMTELQEDTIEAPNLHIVETEKSLSDSSSQGDLPVIPMNPFLFLNAEGSDSAENNTRAVQESTQFETVLVSINQLQSVLKNSVESLPQPAVTGRAAPAVRLSSSSLNPTTTDSDSSSMPVALQDKTKLQAPKKTYEGDSETDYDDLLGSLLDITQIKEPVRNEPPSRTRRFSEAILSATRPNLISRSDQDSGSNFNTHPSATRRSSVAVPKSQQSLASIDTSSRKDASYEPSMVSDPAVPQASVGSPQSASATGSGTGSGTTSDQSVTVTTRRQSVFSGSASSSRFDPSKKVRKFSMALPESYSAPRRFSVMNTSPRVTTTISETPISKEMPFLNDHDVPPKPESDSLSVPSNKQVNNYSSEPEVQQERLSHQRTISDQSGTSPSRRTSIYSFTNTSADEGNSASSLSKKPRRFSMALPEAYAVPRRFSVSPKPRIATNASETSQILAEED